jgi:hypothetical protein
MPFVSRLSTTPNGKDQNCIAAEPFAADAANSLLEDTLSDTDQLAAPAPYGPVTILPDVPASVTYNSLFTLQSTNPRRALGGVSRE